MMAKRTQNHQKNMFTSSLVHQLHSSFLTTTLLLIFTTIHHHVHPAAANTFIYAICSPEKYQSNTPFETNLNSFFSSAISSSSISAYNSFTLENNTSISPPDSSLYGLYQCRGDLKLSECARCVASVVSQMNLVCPYAYGASLQLDTCFLRYEHSDNFLGKLDSNVRFRKCGKSVDNDVEFLRRRDDVLGDLESAVGFRVSSSGLVEGFSQCLGDLSGGDCSVCLTEAVGKLKSLCGSAAAADVFLGQCYARYWASGYYDNSKDSSGDDDVGKTVAIIVGVLAGLAVLVVLLSVCRKSAG